ncbi:MAG: hypothetical protein A3D92_13920 [Bacteroidetes bacterium RIFCSPHIGHO2_02_FULL_44_7]|nr:MAG: hypothetical protein A3D92_13920 [Bacteroidetes bacterium RIFCSPHIGHO2_02_FULL_44_7]
MPQRYGKLNVFRYSLYCNGIIFALPAELKKSSVMKFFVLSTLTVLLFACGTSKDLAETPVKMPEEVPPPSKPQRNAIVASSLGSFEETDPLDIDSLQVAGNKLFIYVHYSGGCREHQF